MRKKQRFALPLLLLLTGFGLVVASLCCGSVELTLGEVGAALFGGETSDTARAIVLDYRLPRLLTALTVGASLGLCGLITQTLFENPLADPSLFGIHAGAAVGAAAGPLIWSSGSRNRPVGGRCDDFIRPLLGACADGLLFHDRRFAQFSTVDTGRFLFRRPNAPTPFRGGIAFTGRL